MEPINQPRHLPGDEKDHPVKTATLPRPETAATSVDTPSFLARVLPGVGLCVAVTLAALALEHVEAALFGRAWLEALVLAILIGTMVRTAWTPGARWRGGIDFSAKTLLEVAVVLLGALIYVLVNLLVDLSYAALDPRVGTR